MVLLVDDKDRRIQQAIDEIYGVYLARVSVKDKRKSLLKFGRNESVGTSFSTIQSQGDFEAYVSDNLITQISSSNAGDTGNTLIEGHVIDTTTKALTFSQQYKVLTGQTAVSLDPPLSRGTRIKNVSATDLAGTVYLSQTDTLTGGVPDTAAKIHCQTDIRNQSWKSSTSLSSTDYWIISQLYCFVGKKVNATVDVVVEHRQITSSITPVFTPLAIAGAAYGGSGTLIDFDPYLIVPANSDVRTIAQSSATGTSVYSHLNGYLATVIKEDA